MTTKQRNGQVLTKYIEITLVGWMNGWMGEEVEVEEEEEEEQH